MKISSRFYIRSIILALLGITFGVLTIYFGLQPSNRSFVFNTDYTLLGYFLRGTCLLCGLVSLYYAILSRVHKEVLRGSLVSLGLALSCILWEVAVFIFLVSLVFFIVVAVAAGS
ncbi:MAG: hypothetical protein WGN25_06480 [Candidatus Electrothrix sp. GW3-4]|uniref:hypothetical protein n=1 Tax=Candidatus Electrothrix sp. GW3-4 TaxID=3126740 RepID=UPI0030CF24F3